MFVEKSEFFTGVLFGKVVRSHGIDSAPPLFNKAIRYMLVARVRNYGHFLVMEVVHKWSDNGIFVRINV